MATGTQVHKEIKDKISNVTAQYNSLAEQIRRSDAVIKSHSEKIEESYVQLAALYLPRDQAESLSSSLREMRSQVQQIFDRRDAQRKQIKGLMDDNESQRKKLQCSLDDIVNDLNAKSEKMTKAGAQVRDYLAADKDYVELKLSADQNQQRLDQAKKRIESFKAEAKEKLKDYESDKFFMYLLRREFGTENYQANKLTAILDSIVASKVNYQKNKESYDFLKKMPDLMEQEVQTQQQDLDKTVQDLKALEKKASEKYNILILNDELSGLVRNRQRLLDSMKQMNEAYRKYQQNLDDLENDKTSYHSEAVGKLKDFLKGQSIEDLKRRARETPDPRDDGLVASIEYASAQMKTEKSKVLDLKSQQKSLGKTLDELKEVESDFTRNDYESTRSSFSSGFDISSHLDALVAGRSSTRAVKSIVSSSQHFKPAETYYSPSYSTTSRSSTSRSSSRSSTSSTPSRTTSYVNDSPSYSGGGGWNVFGGGSNSDSGGGGGGFFSDAGGGGGGGFSDAGGD